MEACTATILPLSMEADDFNPLYAYPCKIAVISIAEWAVQGSWKLMQRAVRDAARALKNKACLLEEQKWPIKAQGKLQPCEERG